MDEKTLLALFDRFEKSNAVEMTYSANGTAFELRRKEAFASAAPAAAAPVSHEAPISAVPAPHVAASPVPSSAAPAPVAPAQAPGIEYVKSPIVGTFYRSPSPDAPPYSEIGSRINKGSKLCIIEAMKMMNALEAEFDCEIVKILVNNGDMVEYDQPIFEVRRI